MTILIVEPDPREAALIAAAVKSAAETPILARSATEAAAALARGVGLALVHQNGARGPVLSLLEAARGCDPEPPVVVMAEHPSFEDAVALVKHGAHDVWVKPVSSDRLANLLRELKRPPATPSVPAPAAIVSRNPVMMRLRAVARQVAASRATVLIQGESGTGKELIARSIHRASDRKNRPFVAVNCAAIPESLLESELFGFERGAFTGAARAKAGKFELAHGGTLLLDEVTEIPVHLQAKLLRALQEGEVDRIGGRAPIRVDARVIATTNRVPEDAVRDGLLRRDLYYRLNVIPLRLPPLRERPEDVEALAIHFIEKYAPLHRASVRGLAREALSRLSAHRWPGNVRELENVIQRAVLLSTDTLVTAECLVFDRETSPAPESALSLMPIHEMERRLIHTALETLNGNRTRAAEALGISVRTLRNKLHAYRREGGEGCALPLASDF